MGFRYTEMGRKVHEDPMTAAAELSEMMRANGNSMGAVADVVGVHRYTLAAWFDKLEKGGHPVEGRGAGNTGRPLGAKDKGARAPGSGTWVRPKGKKTAAPPPGRRRRAA